MRVSTADFIKNFGAVTDRALAEPVTVTRQGRDWLVLMSVEEYQRLKQRDRRVIAEELTEFELDLISKAEVPVESAYPVGEIDRTRNRHDISAIFDLFKDGPETNIAGDKDKMVGQAVWEKHLRRIGGQAPQVDRRKSRLSAPNASRASYTSGCWV